jgi:hypothetical protein
MSSSIPDVPPRQTRGSLSSHSPPTTITTEEQEQQEEIEEQEYFTLIEEPGQTIFEQTVAAGSYRFYKIIIPGNEEDYVVIRIYKLAHSGTTNLYVNLPLKETFPTEQNHQWNPTKGILEGPAGEYLLSVQGVASFSVEDEDDTVVPTNELASYDLSVEWEILDEKERAQRKKTKDQYTREKPSAIWSSSYNTEFQSKYQQQQEDFEKEQQEREQQLGKEEQIQFIFSNAPFLKEFKIGSFLGGNGISFVHAVTEIESGKKFALKTIDKQSAVGAGISNDQLKQQFGILELMDHKNIAKLVKHYETESSVWLIFELCEKDIISHILSSNTYSEDEVQNIVVQLLTTLDYLHSKNIIHRELVPENIFVSKNGVEDIKIIGFNFLSLSEKDYVGSIPHPSYEAPELHGDKEFRTGVDMWQVGVLTYILLSGLHPFYDTNTIRMYSKIRQGKYEFPLDDWKGVSNEAQDFVKSLLCLDKDKRNTAKKALEHSWFKGGKKSSGDIGIVVKKNLKYLLL